MVNEATDYFGCFIFLPNMKITLLAIGKTAQSFVESGIQEYQKRLKHYCNFQFQIIKDVKVTKNTPPKMVKEKEGESYLKHLSPTDYVILLDEKGKSYNSRSWSQHLENLTIRIGAQRNIVFIIGGAFGFSEVLKARAQELLSISDMTFSHQLIRLIFMEQLYRACTIMRNEKYHND